MLFYLVNPRHNHGIMAILGLIAYGIILYRVNGSSLIAMGIGVRLRKGGVVEI